MTKQSETPLTFADVLNGRRGDAKPGIVFEDRTWTWAEVVDECDVRAALLGELCPGERPPHVGLLLENVPDFVFWIGAAALTGATIVGVNPTRRGRELSDDIRHADCELLVTESKYADLLRDVDLSLPATQVLDVDDVDYTGRIAEVAGRKPLPRWSDPRPEDRLFLLFSSGSTGAPKPVICSQRRLSRLALALGERMGIERESVTYLCMPLFHGNALMTNLAPAINVGATVVLARRFSASGFASAVRRHGVTFWNYVGRALAYVLATEPQPDDASCSLQLAYGTEASAADAARFAERFGCRVMEGYGASEGVLRINRVPGTPPGSLGVPVGELRMAILDEDSGAECPPAQLDDRGRLTNAPAAIGQMVVLGGAAAFEGYYNNPEAMKERVRGEDFWTGDLAYRDPEGFVYFAGRTSDWLRVDSENIAAAPIEQILEREMTISQAVVYGVPDARTGDQVMATVALTPGAQFDPEQFGEFLDLQADMGTKWRPYFVRWSTSLPTTANGKVARAQLRMEGWMAADDPVWIRSSDGQYLPLTEDIRQDLVQSFATHDRIHLLSSSGPDTPRTKVCRQ